MDCGSFRNSSCNGSSKTSPPPSPAAGSRAGVNTKEDADGKRKSLLPRVPKGSMARKSRSRSKRRVQWNDSHGKKLVEVLEFQPSDSSDSDDEYLDTCVCSIM